MSIRCSVPLHHVVDDIIRVTEYQTYSLQGFAKDVLYCDDSVDHDQAATVETGSQGFSFHIDFSLTASLVP